MILSDGAIRRAIEAERIQIAPLDLELVQPASLDVRLAREFLVFARHDTEAIDPRESLKVPMERVTVEGGRPFILHPGEFVLGATLEKLALADDIVARVEGKSSLGRLGLLVHATAGFVDPGWGRFWDCSPPPAVRVESDWGAPLTLEFSNVAPLPIKLWPGMRIAQLAFMDLSEPAQRPYGHPDLRSKYTNSTGVTASRYQDDSRSRDR